MDARRLVSRALDVLDVRPGVGVRLRLRAALAAQLQHAIAQAAQERAATFADSPAKFRVDRGDSLACVSRSIGASEC